MLTITPLVGAIDEKESVAHYTELEGHFHHSIVLPVKSLDGVLVEKSRWHPTPNEEKTTTAFTCAECAW